MLNNAQSAALLHRLHRAYDESPWRPAATRLLLRLRALLQSQSQRFWPSQQQQQMPAYTTLATAEQEDGDGSNSSSIESSTAAWWSSCGDASAAVWRSASSQCDSRLPDSLSRAVAVVTVCCGLLLIFYLLLSDLSAASSAAAAAAVDASSLLRRCAGANESSLASFSLPASLSSLPLTNREWCVQTVVTAVQFPPAAACAAASSRSFDFYTAGFGSVFQVMASRLLEAVIHQPTQLLVHDAASALHFAYAAGDGCEQHDWSCFFPPVTGCSESALSPARRVAMSLSDRPLLQYQRDVLDFSRRNGLGLSRDTRLRSLYAGFDASSLPDELHRDAYRRLSNHSAQAYFVLYSAAQLWLFRPERWLQDVIDASKREMGWTAAEEQVICMHVRHGDKASDGNPLFPLRVYMQEAAELRKRHGVRTVFIATDDARRIAPQLPRYERQGWRMLMVEPASEVQLTDKQEAAVVALNNPQLSRAMGVDAIRAVSLLADGQYLIGLCMSQLFRAAVALSFARHRLKAPAVALDYAHCLSSPMHFLPVGEPLQPASTLHRATQAEEESGLVGQSCWRYRISVAVSLCQSSFAPRRVWPAPAATRCCGRLGRPQTGSEQSQRDKASLALYIQ